MAKGNGNATQEPATESTTGTDVQAGTEKKRSNRSYIVVPLPPELKARFESEAEAADQPVGPYVLRNIIAKQLGIEIPVTTTARRSKYASDDERKEAQKVRNKSRSETMRNLMATFRKLQANGVSAEDAVKQASAMVAGVQAPADGAALEASEPEAVPVGA